MANAKNYEYEDASKSFAKSEELRRLDRERPKNFTPEFVYALLITTGRRSVYYG